MKILMLICLLATSNSWATNFDLQAVTKILKDPNVKTVEDFVGRTPVFMRTAPYFTLAYQPHGLISGSFENPTAFLFGDKRSSVVLVFNSKPTSPTLSEGSVEVLSFDAIEAKHTLARIHFSSGKRPSMELRPVVCTGCHGVNPKPLWRSAYTPWTGFYGSQVDALNSTPQEKENFAKLVKNPGARLKLLDLQNAYDFTPGRQATNNLLLTARLANQHVASIANRIVAHPQYQQNKMKLIYGLALCDEGGQRDEALALFDIKRKDWFMNLGLRPDTNRLPGYNAIAGQSFDYGAGPIEYLLLSKIIELDPAVSKSMPRDLLTPSVMSNAGPSSQWCLRFIDQYLTH